MEMSPWWAWRPAPRPAPPLLVHLVAMEMSPWWAWRLLDRKVVVLIGQHIAMEMSPCWAWETLARALGLLERVGCSGDRRARRCGGAPSSHIPQVMRRRPLPGA